MYACIYAPGNLPLLVECARSFSPLVEENPPDSVVFDARGLEALHGPPAALASEIERRVGVPANIAIAPNVCAAMHAARGLRGVTVVEPGKEAALLAPLPLNLLGGSAQTAELLHLWGLKTFGDFAKLPPLGVAARLGEEGVELQRLACGQGYRRLHPMEEAVAFQAEMELEHPVESLEPLAFVLGRLLSEVCASLNSRSMSANEIRLRLILENAAPHEVTLRLPVPMVDQKAFLRMLQLELNGRPPSAPVLKALLEAVPARPRRTQHGLFVPASPEPEKLELTVSRVRHLVGEGRVGTPEIEDSHRPDSFHMRPFAPAAASMKAEPSGAEARLCLRRFRPPKYAQVLLMNEQPVRVMSPVASGRVVVAKGPWRTSGEWWKDDAWNRDEWDVTLQSGGMYRVFQELGSWRWFLEGSYD